MTKVKRVVRQRKRQTWLAIPASGIEVSYGDGAQSALSNDCSEAKDSRRGERLAARKKSGCIAWPEHARHWLT